MPSPAPSRLALAAFILLCCLTNAARADPPPVSYARDVQPILNDNCVSCHRPEKRKGKLDLTTFAALDIGGKSGDAFVAGDPDRSPLVTMVSGDHPEMPEKGDPLTPTQVATLSRWVKEGAKDDTPKPSRAATTTAPATQPAPAYRVAPAITALAWSPDGQTLLVAGHREILLHRADGSGLIARLPTRVARVTSLAFCADGATLMAAGGAPGANGQIELWSWPDRRPLRSFTIPAADTLFGAACSPDARRIAFGCADRTVRVISAADGAEQFRSDAHGDWVLGAAFTVDGARLASAGRDKSLKTFPLASTRPAASEDVNDALDPFTCLARHPTQDVVACGCANGTVRVYRITDLQPRSDQKRDPNQLKQLDRQPGPVNAVAFSPDGKLLAAAATGDVRVYQTGNWTKTASLGNIEGPVFALAFNPDATQLATAGYDGQVHLFDLKTQKPLKTFVPVPLTPAPPAAR